MIPQQSLETYAVFGDNATKVQPDDAKYSAGFQESDVLPAEWMNWAWNKNTKGITDLNTGISSIETELINVLTDAGITPSAATEDQVKQAIYQIIQNRACDFYTADCDTEADTKAKVVTISNFLNTGKATVGVTFTYANTFGDTTASSPTNPTLSINGTEYDICDSRGHIAGTGCWNAGDYIEFKIIGTKAIITNSDVRQSVSGTTGYTIYSTGFIRQYGKFNGTTGDEKIYFPVSFSTTNIAIVVTKQNSSEASTMYSDQWVIRNYEKKYFTVNYFGSAFFIAEGY